jgi:hypothetical protein
MSRWLAERVQGFNPKPDSIQRRVDGLPVARNWTNSPTHAEQIGQFDGKT